MINELFDEFIALSDNLRRDYSISLSKKHIDWEKQLYAITPTIPDLYRIIYSKVSGTQRNIQQQDLMDFIPGYRLIFIEELALEKKILDNILNEVDTSEYYLILPLLGNYSSDYVCYLKTTFGDEYIGLVMHDSLVVEIMHKSIYDFFMTLCAFYKNNIYFLDEDGFLDYDFEKEGLIGSSINKNVRYWKDVIN